MARIVQNIKCSEEGNEMKRKKTLWPDSVVAYRTACVPVHRARSAWQRIAHRMNTRCNWYGSHRIETRRAIAREKSIRNTLKSNNILFPSHFGRSHFNCHCHSLEYNANTQTRNFLRSEYGIPKGVCGGTARYCRIQCKCKFLLPRHRLSLSINATQVLAKYFSPIFLIVRRFLSSFVAPSHWTGMGNHEFRVYK